jgi:hypothetical protein
VRKPESTGGRWRCLYEGHIKPPPEGLRQRATAWS